jgi:Uma2 family endonuclease
MIRENQMSTTTHLMTAEELIQLPRGRYRYELIKGELLTMSPAGDEHGIVMMRLAAPLATYVDTNDLGVVYGAETGFKLENNPDTVLAPDIAFIRRDRMSKPLKGYRSGPPDLVVEIVSPSDSRSKVEEKTAQWLGFGALVVWLVNPQTRTIEIRRPNGQTTLLSVHDELNGEDVIPGFTIPVARIFR